MIAAEQPASTHSPLFERLFGCFNGARFGDLYLPIAYRNRFTSLVMCINTSVMMFAGNESHLMDQLDENLRELKRRVDARVEQMLILRRVPVAETQTLATSLDGSPNMLEQHAGLASNAHTRSAFPLPRGDDPTVVHADKKLDRPSLIPTSGISELPERPTALTAAERLAVGLPEGTVSTSDRHSASSTIFQDRILAHPPAIRRQSFLHRFFGKLLSRKD
jgi:hypothetical protein